MATTSNPTGNAARAGEQMAQVAQETMQNLQERASDAAKTVKNVGVQATNVAKEQMENLRGTAEEYWGQGRDRAMQWEQSLESQIRNQPMRSACIALGIGFLLGACLMRR